jgi:molybdate transport system ATP-binding protein
LTADHSRVVIDDEVLTDSERGVFVPKHRRRVGYVFRREGFSPQRPPKSSYGHWFTAERDRYTALDPTPNSRHRSCSSEV